MTRWWVGRGIRKAPPTRMTATHTIGKVPMNERRAKPRTPSRDPVRSSE
jgi:hypothetical protein